MRKEFFLSSFIVFAIVIGLSYFNTGFLYTLIFLLPLFLVGLRDALQTSQTIRHNFPIIGNFRYMFEKIRPEIQQYFIEHDTQGTPIPRVLRSLVYQRAKGQLETVPFGTQENVYAPNYEWINHTMHPTRVTDENMRVTVGGPNCTKPYSCSLLNISAMSYGALSKNAILALNGGAKLGNFYHNTGEGGVSNYHLEKGGDLVWQIGTGYFGCRTPDGKFNEEMFKTTVQNEAIKMVEIKLSQGAKPGHGGILPKEKLTPEICAIRGVEPGKDVISPGGHSAFNSPRGMIEFVQKLRELSGGKPVGIKLCLGYKEEFVAVCRAMLNNNIYADFITIDGSEGGTGASPLEFTNAVGTPLEDGLVFVHNTLIGFGIRDKIKVIASGKVLSAKHIVSTLALGADIINSARGMMLALGCIQALRCHENVCPTGVATSNPKFYKGLNVNLKEVRVMNFHKNTMKAFREMLEVIGVEKPSQLRRHHIRRRLGPVGDVSLEDVHPYIEKGCLLAGPYPDEYAELMDKSTIEEFQKLHL